MKKLSGVAVVTTAEGERVSYTYMELDDSGNITSQNNRGVLCSPGRRGSGRHCHTEKRRERAAVRRMPHD